VKERKQMSGFLKVIKNKKLSEQETKQFKMFTRKGKKNGGKNHRKKKEEYGRSQKKRRNEFCSTKGRMTDERHGKEAKKRRLLTQGAEKGEKMANREKSFGNNARRGKKVHYLRPRLRR